MAKTNIVFNNTNYSIDESSFSPAAADLRSHLSTVMNGSGAVINLGGMSYNIDSTKLTAATNDFIAHLRTIAGNGEKVIVGGVEYPVDSTKIESAIADLCAVLSDFQSGGSSIGSGMNEYGFYFDRIYSISAYQDGSWLEAAMTLHEDGSGQLCYYQDGVQVQGITYPAGAATYGDHVILVDGTTFAIVNEDGTQITDVDGYTYTLTNASKLLLPTIVGTTALTLDFGMTIKIDSTEEIFTLWHDLSEGNICVEFDGVTYECEPQRLAMFNNAMAIGNCVELGGTGNNEPFIISLQEVAVVEDGEKISERYEWLIVTHLEQSDSTEHRVRIYLKADSSNTNISREVNIFAEQTLAFEPDTDGSLSEIKPPVFTLNVGATYYVEWDGVTYTCVCQKPVESVDMRVIGNASFASSDAEDTGEPFAIAYYWFNDDATANIFKSEDSNGGSHTVRVYQKI